jgi:hypothetical protein
MTLDWLLPMKLCSRLIALIALAIMTSSCSDPLTRDAVSPATFPSEITVIRAIAESTTTQRQGATFPLLDGAFKLTVRGGSTNAGGIIGPYSGTAEVAVPGRASATLEIRVQRATGVASEVTAVAAEGTGAAFVGEGDFTLSLKLSTKNGATSTKVRGTSTISCSAAQRILVTMRGTGSAPRLGDIEVELRHEVGNTICF